MAEKRTSRAVLANLLLILILLSGFFGVRAPNPWHPQTSRIEASSTVPGLCPIIDAHRIVLDTSTSDGAIAAAVSMPRIERIVLDQPLEDSTVEVPHDIHCRFTWTPRAPPCKDWKPNTNVS